MRHRLAFGVAVVVGFAATSYQGATHHASALVLRALVAMLCVALWPRAPLPTHPLLLLAPAWALAVVSVGVVSAADVGVGLQAWVTTLLVVLLYTTLVLNPRDCTDRLLVGAGIIALGHSLWSAAERVLGPSPRGNGGFFNPNDLAAFIAPLAVLAAGAAAAHGPPATARRTTAAWWAAVMVLVLGLWSTGSRSGLVAVGAGLACVLYGLGGTTPRAAPGGAPRIRLRRTVVMGSLLALAALAVATTAHRWLGSDDPFAYSRLDIWLQSARVALAHPWGVGLGGYADTLRLHGVPLHGLVRYPKTPFHAHNELLHGWVELGWPGLLALLLPAAMPLWLLSRRHSDLTPRMHAAELGTWLAFALPALASNTLHVPPVAFLAAIWAARLARRCGPTPRPQSRPLSVGRFSVVLIGGVALGAAVPGAMGVLAMQRAAMLRDDGNVAEALRYARWAERFTPWSPGAALLTQSLRYLQRTTPTADIAAALVQVAERFPTETRPLSRAAWLLESEANVRQQSVPWPLIASLRQEVTERDPTNADAWVRLGMAWRMVALSAARATTPSPEGRAHNTAAEAEEAAQRAFAQALAVEPNCARALAYMAGHAAAQGERERSLALARAARHAHAQRQGVRDNHSAHILALDATTTALVDALLDPDVRALDSTPSVPLPPAPAPRHEGPRRTTGESLP